MKSKISILGGGWLGFSLANAALSAGFEVKASSRKQDQQQKIHGLGCEVFPTDLSSFDVSSPFFDCNYFVLTVPPSSYPDNYCRQLLTVLDVLKMNKNVTVIYTSSISIYKNASTIVRENSPLMSLTKSAEKILKTEKLFQNSQLNYIILRLGGLVGGSRHPVKYLSNKKKIKGAQHPVNLVHREDAVSVILHLIKLGAKNKIFNCCAPEHPTKKEFYTLVAQKLWLSAPFFDNADKSGGKIVSSESLLKSNFKFKFPNPFQFPLSESEIQVHP